MKFKADAEATQLDLSANSNLTDLTLEGAFQNLTLTHNTALKKLSLSNSVKLTELDLSNLSNLESVAVAYQSPVKLNMPAQGLNYCEFTDLQQDGELDLSFCDKVKNLSLSQCLSITTIDMSSCTSLETLLIDGCPKIISLNLTKCPIIKKVTATSCDALQEIILAEGSVAEVLADDNVMILGRNGIGFKDAGFKSYLVGLYDTNGDGEISTEEALKAPEIKYSLPYPNTPNPAPISLKGIECFTNLKSLEIASSWTYTLLDFDISNLSRLQTLSIGSLAINSLDLSSNSELTNVTLKYKALDSQMIDFSNNAKIEIMTFGVTNLNMPDVNLSALPALKRLIWNADVNLLDVSQNANLEMLSVRYSDTPHVNLPSGVKELSLMSFVGTSIDLSNCTLLQSLDISTAKNLKSIDLPRSSSLTSVSISASITTLNTSAATALSSLTIGSSSIKTLDLSANTALTNLNCYNNTSLAGVLDLAQNTNLKSVRVATCPAVSEVLLPQSIEGSVSASIDAAIKITYVP